MIVCTEIALLIGNYLAKLRLKPMNDSVFLLSVFSLVSIQQAKHGQKEHGI